MKTDVHDGNDLRVFVYGTLKKGFSNHESYCGGVLRILPASICGRLFKLTPEIPVMTIPAGDVLARGSADPVADMRLPAEFSAVANERRGTGPGLSRPAGEWKTIKGEVLVFDDPETRLPLMDELEEFRPGEESTYLRVLVRVTLADGSPSIAWTYIAGFDIDGIEIFDGDDWFPDE